MSFYILEIAGSYMKLGYTVQNLNKLVTKFAAHYPKFDLHIWNTPHYHPIFAKRTIKNKMLQLNPDSAVKGPDNRSYGDLFWLKSYKQDMQCKYFIEDAKQITNKISGTHFIKRISFNCKQTSVKYTNT